MTKIGIKRPDADEDTGTMRRDDTGGRRDWAFERRQRRWRYKRKSFDVAECADFPESHGLNLRTVWILGRECEDGCIPCRLTYVNQDGLNRSFGNGHNRRRIHCFQSDD